MYLTVLFRTQKFEENNGNFRYFYNINNEINNEYSYRGKFDYREKFIWFCLCACVCVVHIYIDTYIYIYIYIRIYIYLLEIGMMIRVFVSGPGDLGSIPGRVKPKTKKNLTWYLLT